MTARPPIPSHSRPAINNAAWTWKAAAEAGVPAFGASWLRVTSISRQTTMPR